MLELDVPMALARKGSERAMCGPEPCMGLSIGTIKNAIKENADQRHISEWMLLNGLKHSKKFINNITTGLRRNILAQERGNIRLLTGALTEHFATNEQLTRMGLAIDPTCRACGDDVVSMKHLLCECDALARKRMSVLGRAYPEPEDFRYCPLGGTSQLCDMSLRRRGTTKVGVDTKDPTGSQYRCAESCTAPKSKD